MISLLSMTSLFAQSCPITDFSVDNPTLCIDEQIDISNLTTGGNGYAWDFCSGDLQETPVSTEMLNSSLINRSFDIALANDNNQWFGFATSSTGNRIAKIDFQSQLNNSPTASEISSSFLNAPKAIEIIKIADSWYALVGNNSDNHLILLEFGADLDSNPNISSFDNLLPSTEITDIEVFEYEGAIYAFVVNEFDNELVLLSFGSSLTNTPSVSSETIIDASSYTDLAIVRDCDQYYGLLTSFDDRTVVLLSFGTDPTTVESTTELALAGVSFNSRPTNAILTNEGGVFQGFVLIQLSGDIVRIDFGDSMGNTPTGTTFSDVVPDGVVAFDLAQDSSDWVGFTIGLNSNRLYRLDWLNPCSASPEFSTAEIPAVSYGSDGNYKISLESMDASGNSSFKATDITVNIDRAPSISYTSDNNLCITSQINFSPSTNSLSSYNWDFNGDDIVDVTDMTGADQSFDYSGLGAGTYTVRLDVSDGTCNNFYEQEITIYDPPPAPSYTYSSVQTCINADFTFTNTTADGAYTGPLEYLWEFIDEPSGIVVATATTKDAVYAFETEGQKTVRLTSSIPGCTEVTEQTLMITPGPTANFFAASVCQNEAMQFTNTSSDAISYSWDFGDGFMSTATNPSHIFTGAGNFFVTLTATDAEGCEDSEVIEVAVSDSPQINFDFDIPCTSADGIQFYDLTTVDNADLVSWTWFVDDVEVSTAQSPQIVFGSTGMKNIRLVVGSSNGCESSYSEDVEVLSAPSPDFTINVGCQGESSSFIDITPSTGNPIVSWLWTIDGVNYGTQDADHIFNDAGTFDVTLEVTGQNFCSETITKSVEIIELPTVDFSIIGECDNQLIEATDQSTASADPVIARRWRLDGINVGNGAQLVLENLSNDTYDLELELETQGGCVISSAQSIVINDAPESSFSSSRTYGIPNDQLTFTNTSTGGSSFQWLLDGEVRSMDPQAESITFSSSGTFLVSLVSQNSLGCYDTATQEILIAVPEVDLAIGSFELVNENGTGKIFLEVQNFSNLPVEIVDVQLVLENTFAITEQIVGFIDVGSTSLISLNAGIPLTVSEPSYFCAKLSSQYVGYPDIEPVNNEKCITIDPIIKVEDPFPNPVADQFRLKLIVNDAGSANISLLNSAGKVQLSSVKNVTEGLNNYFIDMSLLNPGIYYVVVDVMGTTHKKKVIKL